MATLSEINNESLSAAIAIKIDMKTEVTMIPVSDVDRAK